jgi:Trp operon repressor
MFENRLYPAGEYEALRITIGSGQGQNWWCVLFPPLCLVDGVKVPKAKATMNLQTKSKIGQMGGISEAEIMEKMLKGGMSEAEIMEKMLKGGMSEAEIMKKMLKGGMSEAEIMEKLLKGGMSEAEIMEKLKNGGIGEFKAMSSSLEMNNAGDWEELEVRFFFLDMFYSAQTKIKGWF